MTSKELFAKTKPFVRAKLALGAAFVGICLLLFFVLIGLGWLFGDTGMVVMAIAWLASIRVVHLVVMNYFGYMIKAGHVAVIAEATATGRVPENQVAYGKDRVKERFLTSNVYLVVDKLVTAAIKQIQNKIAKLGDKLDFIPGMDMLSGAAQIFISILLGYVDECCLGWTFRNPDDSAFKSAADGVLIYVQNWKALLKSAAMTLLKTLVLCVVMVLAIFVPVGILFKILKWNGMVAFILACMIAWIIKFAYMDSYIMIQMMGTYMEVAPNTRLAFDLYGKVSSWSASFKELYTKGQEEQATMNRQTQEQPAMQPETPPAMQPTAQPVMQTEQTPINRGSFCGQCGTKNDAGAKFCVNCGNKMEG